MNLENLDAQMNAAIIFSVYYGDLPEPLVKKLQNEIILLFGRDDAIKLTEEDNLETKISNKKDKKEIQFTVRKLFHLRIESDVFWSPFEIINLVLSITVQPITDKEHGGIKINLMDNDSTFLKLSYTEEGTFGNYDLAENKMKAHYSNERVLKLDIIENKETQREYFNENLANVNEKSKLDHFQYAHFNIPLYKFPIVALATIFLPLWLLGIINLGIFFQDENLADRIASIAALMIAFVALIPTIREQIPPNPKIVFIEILVYMETLTSLFALIHSLDVRKIEMFDLIWYESGLFMVSFVITIVTVVLVVALMVAHYFFWEPSYNRSLDEEKDVKFVRSEWNN